MYFTDLIKMFLGSGSSGEESEDEWVESDKNKSVDTSVPDKSKEYIYCKLKTNF